MTEPTNLTLLNRIFENLGLDLSKPHLEETPKRIIKMWKALILNEGKKPNKKLLTLFPTPKNLIGQEITVGDIPFSSICSHHFFPFNGKVSIRYSPTKVFSGISKFARIVEFYSLMPQIQEEFTNQVLTYLWNNLKPNFIEVIVVAEHTCMTSRGIKAVGSMTTTKQSRKKDKSIC